MTKFKTDSDLLKAMNDYHLSYRRVNEDNHKEVQAVLKTGRKALYANLAMGYGLCLAMHDPENSNAVAEALSARDIKAATGRTNPFLPLVRAVYGNHQDEAAINSPWEPNRSAEKYANVFRLAQELGKTQAQFADWLLNYKDQLGNRMIGAEKRDRANNGVNDPAAEEKIVREVKVVLSSTPFAVVSLPNTIADVAEKYVCIWGKVDGKKFNAFGMLPNMTGTVERYLRKEAPDLAKALVEARIIAEAKADRKLQSEAATV